MISFFATLLKFGQHGEKTNWTYIEMPEPIIRQLKPGIKKSFRVKGLLDEYVFSGIALIPMGGGTFIMPLKAAIIKGIKKGKGATVKVQIEVDVEYKVVPPNDLLACLHDEPEAGDFFNQLSKSHRDYFIKWIESAKTDETRNKRIVQTIIGLSKNLSYGEMIRLFKNK